MREQEWKNRNFLIQNWFYNLINGKINDAILVLIDDYRSQRMLPSLKIKTQVNIYNSAKSVNYTFINNTKYNQIIIIDSLQKNNLDFTNITTKLLLVPALCEFYKEQDKYIQSPVFTDIKIDASEQYLYWLEKEVPLDFIYRSDIDLLDFINKKIWMVKLILGDDYISITNNSTIDIQTSLQTDIQMLRGHRILTSRLAIMIYRTATLDINANVTKIGRHIHQKTGTKSKTFNARMMKGLSINGSITISRDLVNKNFKAYNLNVNETDLAIRTEIANNLLSYNLTNLTVEMIANSTKLPIEIVKKLHSAFDSSY